MEETVTADLHTSKMEKIVTADLHTSKIEEIVTTNDIEFEPKD